MIRFFFVILIVVAMLAGLMHFAVQWQWITAPSFFLQTLLLVGFITVVLFAYLYKAGKPQFFVQLYLLTMMVKIIAYGAYVYFMIREDAMGVFANVVFFLIAYFIFTTLEIVFLYRKISTTHTA